MILPNDHVALHATKVRPVAKETSQRCKWMFADAAAGPIGFKEAAHLNPFRWSSALTVQGAVSALEEQKNTTRPIRLAFLPGDGAYQEFKTAGEAIEHLRGIL